MGCDIHTRIEFFNERNGKWLCGDLFRINPYYRADEPSETEPFSVVEVCGDRNYLLFSVLADVRNYSSVPCICQPRGIPNDACGYTKKEFISWGNDAHSASYFSLKELAEYRDSMGVLKRSGMVSVEAAKGLKLGIEPCSWCQATNAPGFTFAEWETTYNPLDELIEALKKRGYELGLWYSENRIKENADRLRFIFWFDS